ncbi:MAG: alpha/beta hydrolase [Pseudomonadota bacterium]
MSFYTETATFNAAGAQSALSYHRAGGTAKALPAWIVRSASGSDAPPLVAIHGISRGAQEQAEAFARMALKTGRTVIAPLFSHEDWRGYQRITNRYRGDRALLALLRRLEQTGIVATDRFDLFGYSGGAQFAHRFAMLYPQRITRLHLAAAGWYCLPDRSAPYPYALGTTGHDEASWGCRMAGNRDAFLGLPLALYIGAEDTDRDTALRSTVALDAQQGFTRLDRIRTYKSAFEKQAWDRGISPRTSLTVLHGCGHSFADCIRIGGLDQHVFS